MTGSKGGGGQEGRAGRRKPGEKSVRLDLDPDIHRDFRVQAALEGVSMSQLARRVIEEWLKARRPPPPR